MLPKRSLSARQQQVLILLARGLTRDAVANELSISVHTVDSHMDRIFRYLGVSNLLVALRYVDPDGQFTPPARRSRRRR
jgi:DNA-binding CsgD family transcriptional regulator